LGQNTFCVDNRKQRSYSLTSVRVTRLEVSCNNSAWRTKFSCLVLAKKCSTGLLQKLNQSIVLNLHGINDLVSFVKVDIRR